MELRYQCTIGLSGLEEFLSQHGDIAAALDSKARRLAFTIAWSPSVLLPPLELSIDDPLLRTGSRDGEGSTPPRSFPPAASRCIGRKDVFGAAIAICGPDLVQALLYHGATLPTSTVWLAVQMFEYVLAESGTLPGACGCAYACGVHGWHG